MQTLRLILTLFAVFILPGWAVVSILRLPQRPALQRWCLAVSASIAFYPVLFYAVRFLAPAARLGVNKNIAILAACAVVGLLASRKEIAGWFRLERLEWLSASVIGLTLLSRLWIIRGESYPAWTDSLHHTLLTLLTAAQGRLPDTLQPYAPIPLEMYHLGLYSLSGVVMQLAGVPAHTALLYTAQVLNGLCAVGVYLALDRMVSRRAAFAGLVVVGLLSFQPAHYVNWGRFTQLSSQVILLSGWAAAWEMLQVCKETSPKPLKLAAAAVLAALLNAGIFLLHFRAAAFYLPLLGFSVAWEWLRAGQPQARRRMLLVLLLTGLISLVLILPVLLPALKAYLSSHPAAVEGGNTAVSSYYSYSFRNLFDLGLQPWLFVVWVLFLAVGLARRKPLSWISLAWVAALTLLGNAYLLHIPVLNISNFTGIMILFYLPAGLAIAVGLDALLDMLPTRLARQAQALVVIVLFAGGLASVSLRVKDIEPWRFFMTPADEAAMAWIRANTPADAVFAINTSFWSDKSPIGTDGGYWIPYLTGRQTTASSMLYGLAAQPYRAEVVRLSETAAGLAANLTVEAIDSLCLSGVDFVYIGARGNPLAPALKADHYPQAQAVYQRNGVSIFKLCK